MPRHFVPRKDGLGWIATPLGFLLTDLSFLVEVLPYATYVVDELQVLQCVEAVDVESIGQQEVVETVFQCPHFGFGDCVADEAEVDIRAWLVCPLLALDP